jgi:phosphatidylinositol phospholipase C delta
MQPNELVDTESSTTSAETSTDSEILSGLSPDCHNAVPGLMLSLESKHSPSRKQSFSDALQGISRSRNVLRRHSPSNPLPPVDKVKVRMSRSLVSLLVYTVGVKCRGINKKEHYPPEHMFSLSEWTANKMFKRDGVLDLIKHNRTHLVRIYPRGTRVSSTNFVPLQYWSAGIQLVALNWQTYGEFGLRSAINYTLTSEQTWAALSIMRCSSVTADLDTFSNRLLFVHKIRVCLTNEHGITSTSLCVLILFLMFPRALSDARGYEQVISAQQLPLPKDAHGREIIDKSAIDRYVEVSVHFPDWGIFSLPPVSTSALQVSDRTSTVKNNGFNPVWDETLSLPFEVLGDMRELVFVRFAVREDGDDENEALAVHCVSLACLREGNDISL